VTSSRHAGSLLRKSGGVVYEHECRLLEPARREVVGFLEFAQCGA
jgi:hypothetical protein